MFRRPLGAAFHALRFHALTGATTALLLHLLVSQVHAEDFHVLSDSVSYCPSSGMVDFRVTFNYPCDFWGGSFAYYLGTNLPVMPDNWQWEIVTFEPLTGKIEVYAYGYYHSELVASVPFWSYGASMGWSVPAGVFTGSNGTFSYYVMTTHYGASIGSWPTFWKGASFTDGECVTTAARRPTWGQLKARYR